MKSFLLALSLTCAATGATPTFSADIAPIFYQHCTPCHHGNDLAPMPLLTYKDAKPWAAAIREAVAARTMPPWKADPHYGKFTNDSSLSDAEIATVKAWVDGGKPEGDPTQLPPEPTYTTGWHIREPDMIFAIPRHELSAKGPDEYEKFVVHTDFKEDRWVVAAELRPGNRKVVHHAHVSVEQASVPKPALPTTPDPQAEYRKWLMVHEGKLSWIRPEAPVIDNGCVVDDNSYLPGSKPVDAKFGAWGMLASYLPGRGADVYPEGTARRIPAGSDLVFQLHYSKSGKPEVDETSVGLIFAKEPPVQPAKRVDLGNHMFRLPAGDPNVEVTECHTFKQDMYVTSLTPHMHLRGKDSKFVVTYPDGKEETLLLVPHYNFNWQITYKLAEPKFLPTGTRMAIISHFDNSANNPLNPDPTQVVRWGEASEMEMMDGWIEYLDRPYVARARGK